MAGITILTLTGENGILTRAENAKEKTHEEQEKEIVQLSVVGAKDYITGIIDEEKLKTELTSNSGGANKYELTKDGNTYEVMFKDCERVYIIDGKGNVKISKEEDEILEVPESYYHSFQAGDDIVAYVVENDEEDGVYDILFIGEGEMFPWDEWDTDKLYEYDFCVGMTFFVKIKSVKISKGITNIVNYAFSEFEDLTSVIIPSSVTSIGSAAFKWCSKLQSIILPEGLVDVGEYAFYGCSSLESVTIPSTVTIVGNNVFGGWSKLTNITINKEEGSLDTTNWGTSATITWNPTTN